ncbi:hypothetical protein OG618_08545 [Kitasatospora sp. NBC_01246]|uniref:hypothetical protein n=1 Tax=Kitasatospora sp. NBC_01246 TaxID=2903570 RepID=UPI002E34C0AD|nr:hypothetical protein [Kitasatospora sp. NBC_01246]
MLESVGHLEKVAKQWNVNTEDVLLIALNACGARSPLTKPRMRSSSAWTPAPPTRCS